MAEQTDDSWGTVIGLIGTVLLMIAIVSTVAIYNEAIHSVMASIPSVAMLGFLVTWGVLSLLATRSQNETVQVAGGTGVTLLIGSVGIGLAAWFVTNADKYSSEPALDAWFVIATVATAGLVMVLTGLVSINRRTGQ